MSRQGSGRCGLSTEAPPVEEKEEHDGDNANEVSGEDAEEEEGKEQEEEQEGVEAEEELWSSDWEEEDEEYDDNFDGCDEDEDDDAAFEIGLEDGWQPLDVETNRRIARAEASGRHSVEFQARGQLYIIDLPSMRLTNRRTGVQRPIRRCEQQGGSSDDDGDDEDGATLDLQPLRDLLRQPSPVPPQLAGGGAATLDAQQIREAIERLVPEASTWVAPRSDGTPALDFLVQSYSHGLPAFPPAVSRHLAEGVQVIMGAISDPEGSGITRSRAGCLARQLAEAFTSCQAVQARTIDALQAEVRGVVSRSLAAQLWSLVEEHRELALDRTICHFHPRAPTASDADPTQQLPHLVNRYRLHLGRHAGLAGGPRAKAAAADRNARGPLPVPRQRAVRRFWREFSIRELLRAVVADVNQTDSEATRRLDRDLIMSWAGSEPSIGHRIFYDEATPELYAALAPSREQRALRQPALHEGLAAELLRSALGGRLGGRRAEER